MASHNFDYEKLSDIFSSEIEEAILIRCVENTFLDLFSEGLMNGTVHTCVGQEFSAVAVCSDLNCNDWVTSNHRCHGHYISKTKDWTGLIDELMGLESGVCKGIGSSQHLYKNGFLSNGPQGSLLPVASGIGYFLKKSNQNNIVISFVGEGTLGEGVLYESLNLSSILDSPHLFVLENNLYSQSTNQAEAISGEIIDRPKAFNIQTFETNTWDLEHLFNTVKEAKDFVRKNKKPVFLKINTYRLNAHSKSDDDRDADEINFFLKKDPLKNFLDLKRWEDFNLQIENNIRKHIENSDEKKLSFNDYCHDQLPRSSEINEISINNNNERMINSLNKAYLKTLSEGSFFIGEDIKDPYGGAFKVTKGFSDHFPDQVINSPISESAITGFGIGLSLMGNKPFIEIMFGDFTTHIFDQLITNASKFYHMYAFQCSAPVRVRTPMGGKRGYGPTHSQSLEKFFLGIDNLLVVALTSLQDPSNTIDEIQKLDCPALVIENKIDYGKYLFQENEFLKISKVDEPFGLIHATPINGEADISIISYGGTAREIVDSSLEIYLETELSIEVFCITALHPLNLIPILESIKHNNIKGVLVIEDHSSDFGLGSEIIAGISEAGIDIPCKKIGAEPFPIPSFKELEDKILPTQDFIISNITKFKDKIYD
uniref:Pyruvate/2-oxoglutarate dehydrogenase complex, dehydrogenase (E1) component, eukaryotic type, alpha subunit n=1 Tax=uncultured gamma proteobacterium HF0500_05P21 TaxID=723572 RepID=E7C4S9_9GAMM|nr:pyruvate/2-oxoglutarate dehydrogenase complex, dehydrogenase (E1) component, eukaryotic type, alpha subunit [uncultured gamma proteobacterium HF0500_05P21]